MNNLGEHLAQYVPQSGQKTRILCESCGGGSTSEKSLIVSNENGRIAWYCFRDKCGERGQHFTGMANMPVLQAVEPPALRPYDASMFPLTREQLFLLKDGYGVDGNTAGIKSSHDGRFLLPIRTYYGDVMGWISRRPWCAPDDGTPKSLTYWHERGPLLAWNARPRYTDERASVVLAVEDQLSAIRYHQFHPQVAVVALLGTGVNQEKIGAIQRHTDNLVIALDSDATGQAFNIARKWGQAFKSCRVQILECDIKDMHASHLHSLVI